MGSQDDLNAPTVSQIFRETIGGVEIRFYRTARSQIKRDIRKARKTKLPSIKKTTRLKQWKAKYREFCQCEKPRKRKKKKQISNFSISIVLLLQISFSSFSLGFSLLSCHTRKYTEIHSFSFSRIYCLLCDLVCSRAQLGWVELDSVRAEPTRRSHGLLPIIAVQANSLGKGQISPDDWFEPHAAV